MSSVLLASSELTSADTAKAIQSCLSFDEWFTRNELKTR